MGDIVYPEGYNFLANIKANFANIYYPASCYDYSDNCRSYFSSCPIALVNAILKSFKKTQALYQ